LDRTAGAILTLAVLVGCSVDNGLPPVATNRVQARFPAGGVVNSIEVDAVNRLPLRTAELVAPDSEAMARLGGELGQSRAELARQEALLAQLEEARAIVEERRRADSETQQVLQRELSVLEGTLGTLQKIQSQVEENSKVHDWIDRHQLGSRPRLWQKIRVDQGWETAVESVLRERLHAMEMSDPELLQRLLEDPPPARVSAFSPGGDAELRREKGFTPLADYVKAADPAVGGVIAAQAVLGDVGLEDIAGAIGVVLQGGESGEGDKGERKSF